MDQAIVEYATERINRSAGDVVKAFLDFGRDKMKRLDEEESRMLGNKCETT